MKITYLLFCLVSSAFAQVPPSIQVLPNPQTPEDFDHQFKGCPQNSECDQAFGLLMQRWKDLINKVSDEKLPVTKKVLELEAFRNKHGLPTEFYTREKSQLGFKPALFSSACKDHNPKDLNNKTLKGLAFVKSMTSSKAIVWRDQTQIEVPFGDLLQPQLVTVYWDSPVKYFISLGDQPLFIKGRGLHILKEEDGFYFMLKVSESGEWKIENVDLANLSKWEDQRQNVPCPPDKEKPAAVFSYEFCKTVFDDDLKKTVIVKMTDGCSN